MDVQRGERLEIADNEYFCDLCGNEIESSFIKKVYPYNGHKYLFVSYGFLGISKDVHLCPACTVVHYKKVIDEIEMADETNKEN